MERVTCGFPARVGWAALGVLAALVAVGCTPSDTPSSTRCNTHAQCPALQECRDGVCTARGVGGSSSGAATGSSAATSSASSGTSTAVSGSGAAPPSSGAGVSSGVSGHGSSSTASSACFQCGGRCVDPRTDVEFCGAQDDCLGANAGESCLGGKTCFAGRCVSPCPSGLLACRNPGSQTQVCVDATRSNAFCGAQADCQGTRAGQVCPDHSACSDGTCTCLPGYTRMGGQCVFTTCLANSTDNLCTVPNGLGMQACNATGTAFTGDCAATVCDSGFHLQSGNCVPNVCPPDSLENACPVPNGSGVAACNDTGSALLPPCVATACTAGHHLQDGTCMPNVCVPNSTGNMCVVLYGQGVRTCDATGAGFVGGCTPTTCNPGYTLQNGVCRFTSCTPGAVTPCAVPHGVGTQACNADGSGFAGACTGTQCNAGFHLQAGSCVPNTCLPDSTNNACTVPQGSGLRTCNSTGSAFVGPCTATQCNPGFHLQGGQCVANVCPPGANNVPCTTAAGAAGFQSCNATGSAFATGCSSTVPPPTCSVGFPTPGGITWSTTGATSGTYVCTVGGTMVSGALLPLTQTTPATVPGLRTGDFCEASVSGAGGTGSCRADYAYACSPGDVDAAGCGAGGSRVCATTGSWGVCTCDGMSVAVAGGCQPRATLTSARFEPAQVSMGGTSTLAWSVTGPRLLGSLLQYCAMPTGTDTCTDFVDLPGTEADTGSLVFTGLSPSLAGLFRYLLRVRSLDGVAYSQRTVELRVNGAYNRWCFVPDDGTPPAWTGANALQDVSGCAYQCAQLDPPTPAYCIYDGFYPGAREGVDAVSPVTMMPVEYVSGPRHGTLICFSDSIPLEEERCGAGTPPPLPTCTLGATPTSGTTATSFALAWSSANATTCSYVFDGNPAQSIACAGMLALPGADVGVGVHNVVLTVTGTGGSASCNTSFTVTAPPPAPTCSLTAAPQSGTLQTTFSAVWSSTHASTCSYTLDNGTAQSIPCNGDLMFPGSSVGVGTHTLAFDVSGSGGSTRCNASFTVLPPGTCTLNVTPGNGTLATAFLITWSSANATTCSYVFNGGAPVTVDCAGMLSLAGQDVGTGEHTLVLSATGTGGTGTCNAAFTVTN